ncbi:MAG: DUF6011 domain-containing protein, partial [Bacillota bacterium]|nr:DUF6011 domain-containing protein [Bacillota bacterium]
MLETGKAAAGQCVRCGRKLKDPISVERKMGPVCWTRSGRNLERSEQEEQPLLPLEADIVCQRTEHGPQFNIPQRIVLHSP